MYTGSSDSPCIRSSGAMLVVLWAVVWTSFAFCSELHDVVNQGDLAKVQALVKSNPALVFSKDSNGNTPLHLAAAKGYGDVAELLLANHADVNARNNKGESPCILRPPLVPSR